MVGAVVLVDMRSLLSAVVAESYRSEALKTF
jgi:hypothetical protein